MTHLTPAQTADVEDTVQRIPLTVIKCVYQLTWIDFCSTNQNVVQCPLCTLHPRNHNPIADHKRLPPAESSCIGEGVLREEDVVMSHRNVFLEIHLMKQSPSNSYKNIIVNAVTSGNNPQTSSILPVLSASQRNLYPGRKNGIW